MKFVPGHIYYVFNEGNNKENLFLTDNDYQTFLYLIDKQLLPFADIISYSLLPNQFHLQLHARPACATILRQGGIYIDPLTDGIRKLLSGYTRTFNHRNKRSGSLFRQKTRSVCLSKENMYDSTHTQFDYCIACLYFIQEDIIQTSLSIDPHTWQWSSYNDYSKGIAHRLCNLLLASKFCGYNIKDRKFTALFDTSLLNFFQTVTERRPNLKRLKYQPVFTSTKEQLESAVVLLK